MPSAALCDHLSQLVKPLLVGRFELGKGGSKCLELQRLVDVCYRGLGLGEPFFGELEPILLVLGIACGERLEGIGPAPIEEGDSVACLF